MGMKLVELRECRTRGCVNEGKMDTSELVPEERGQHGMFYEAMAATICAGCHAEPVRHWTDWRPLTDADRQLIEQARYPLGALASALENTPDPDEVRPGDGGGPWEPLSVREARRKLREWEASA